MILCKTSDAARKRQIKNVNIAIEELPHRPEHAFKGEKERIKFIKSVEQIIRSSLEYKDYIKFLRENMHMNRCAVLKNIVKDGTRKYSIEIHHEPFTLFYIVAIVLTKYEDLGKFINPYEIAEEVMELHYEGKVGLIPLSLTQHELVHDAQIFIPLQHIYQDYHLFYEEYEPWIPPEVQDMLQFKVDWSMKCGSIQSDVLEPEFVYVNVDGFDFPNVPTEWADRKRALEPPVGAENDSEPIIYHGGDKV